MSVTFDATYVAIPILHLSFQALLRPRKQTLGLGASSSFRQCGYHFPLGGGPELAHLQACPQMVPLCVPGLCTVGSGFGGEDEKGFLI